MSFPLGREDPMVLTNTELYLVIVESREPFNNLPNIINYDSLSSLQIIIKPEESHSIKFSFVIVRTATGASRSILAKISINSQS